MSRKDGVLILECLGKSDLGSEGYFLAHMFDLMNVESQYVEVRTKYQLLALLKKPPYKVIHITTHGSVRGKGQEENFCGLWTKEGTISHKQIKELDGQLKGCTIVSTACLSGEPTFSEIFIKGSGCAHYIAPTGSPRFHNSIFFAHIFYHKHFILKKEVKDILLEYNDRYKNPHKFSSISFEDFIDSALDKKIASNKSPQRTR